MSRRGGGVDAGDGEMPAPTQAIAVRHVHKSYRRGKVKVLKDLSLTVAKGTIYGLLGPSGCGKTSLLKCIVGRLTVDSGTLEVLGDEPNVVGHAVPGSLVGYMPQEIALYDKFTVMETLYFCARLHQVPKHKCEPRATFLLNLLDIKHLRDRRIENLSGGQKRRVSFIAALLHEPELLVTDEPTVGVDPILRARIWQHLRDLTKSPNPTTILITTHYIEEARQAHCVGMMRDGHLLAEDQPDYLMHRFQLNTLEEVFLHLCTQHQASSVTKKRMALTNGQDALDLAPFPTQSSTSSRAQSINNSRNGYHAQAGQHSDEDDAEDVPLLKGEKNPSAYSTGYSASNASAALYSSDEVDAMRHQRRRKKKRWGPGRPTWRNFSALFVKNLRQLGRHPGHLIFQFLLPALQVALFCLAIGRAPVDLNMAVVNNDTGVDVLDQKIYLSHLFLDELNNKSIIQRPMETMDDALSCVKRGKCWGIYEFFGNYSEDLMKRAIGKDVTKDIIYGSQIGLSLDNTNEQITMTLVTATGWAFDRMVQKISPNPLVTSSPIRFEDPIYGEKNPSFTDFISPGIMVSITFAQAIGLTAIAFVMDAKEGLLDRVWAAGGRPSDVILAHVATQVLIVAGQCLTVLIVAILIFDLPHVGSLFLVIILIMLIGLSGMTYGLFISTQVSTEVGAIQAAMGSFFPVLLLSGILWPLEGTPTWVRYISYILPTTWAADGMRSLMLRGWGIDRFDVWMGFVIVLGWSTLFVLLAVFGIKSVN